MSGHRAVGAFTIVALAALTLAARRPASSHKDHAVQLSVPNDPPGFGLVPVSAGQTIRMNVVCYQHQVGLVPPDPCRGTIMFHDAAGNILRQASLTLKPGQADGLSFTFSPVSTNGVVTAGIDPCWLPGTGGRAIPTVEVFDASGRLLHYVNPAAGRMAEVSNGQLTDPGGIVGFNPQPDPPGFGLVTVRPGESLQMSVSCFAHQVGVSPPDPCRGSVMFHDAVGNLVQGGTYDLKPGESFTFVLTPRIPSAVAAVTSAAGFEPCIIPAAGRALPAIEIVGADGTIEQLINPAVSRLSELDQ